VQIPLQIAFRNLPRSEALGDLPLYNQDGDANQAQSVKRMKREIAAAQGLLYLSATGDRRCTRADQC